MPTWQFKQIQTTDVDELSTALPGWQQRYTKLQRGQFSGELTLATGGGLQVYRERTRGILLEEGETGGHRIGLAIPVRASGDVFSFGNKITSCSQVMGFFSPRRLHLRTPEDFELLVVSVNTLDLPGFCTPALPKSVSRQPTTCLGQVPPWMRQELIDLMAVLLDARLDERHVARAGINLLDCLEEALLKFESMPVRAKAVACRQTVEQALTRVGEWMQQGADKPLNVARLCAELDIPRRTLQYAFEQALGITPLQYLKSVRLAGSRHHLKQGEGSVLAAGLLWGFDHPSAFARDYQAMFGEYPSQTLERARLRRGQVYSMRLDQKIPR